MLEDTNTNNNIRILIADDHPLMRGAIKELLNKHKEFEVIGEAENGKVAVELSSQLVPNVVILDIGMPVMNGLEAVKLIKSAHPEIHALVLTVHDESELALSILQSGAEGYLTKNATASEIISAVNAVVAGDTILSPSISKQIYKFATSQYPAKPARLSTDDNLSSREIEIIRLIAKGLSNKEIALRLHLSVRTIKSHLEDIFLKLDARSRVETVVICLRNGVLSLDDLNEGQ